MNVGERIRNVILFLEEVRGEVKKTAWPNRQELFESTIVVVVSVLLLSLFIALCDQILAALIGLLVG